MIQKTNFPRIGVNLYSVRQHCLSQPDLERSLERIKAIGYAAVQVSGIPQFSPEQVRASLDKHGLEACAAHDNLASLTGQAEQVINKLATLGCRFTALGHPGAEMLEAGRIPELCEMLVKAGGILKSAGLKLGYHNHADEFAAYRDTSILDWLYANSPADVLFAEPDSCWIQVGGGNPEAWIRRLAGRIPAVHLKDYTWTAQGPRLCEVGRGNLDWPGILRACLDVGIPEWIVEQDHPVTERDIFASLEISFKTIKSFLGEQ